MESHLHYRKTFLGRKKKDQYFWEKWETLEYNSGQVSKEVIGEQNTPFGDYWSGVGTTTLSYEIIYWQGWAGDFA